MAANVWLPALFGATGAFLGAGASIAATMMSLRGQRLQRQEDRDAAHHDREGQLRDERLQDAASTLSMAFSLLHDMRFLAHTVDTVTSKQLDGIRADWDLLKDRLYLLGIGYPEQETAISAMHLAAMLTGVFNWFENLPEPANRDDSSVDDASALLFALMNRVRRLGGLDVVVEEANAQRE